MATIKTRQPNRQNFTIGYRQSALQGWQYSNKSALDIINEYQKKIQNGDWLSSEDRQKYKSAIDTYTSTGNKLREASKHYGQIYSADEEKSWNDSLSSLSGGYNDIEKFYGQFASDKEFNARKLELDMEKMYNDRVTNANASKGSAGYQSYLDSLNKETKKDSFVDTLNNSFNPLADNPLTSMFVDLVNYHKEDTSYMRPNDEWDENEKNAFGELYLESPDEAYKFAEIVNNRRNKAKELEQLGNVQSAAVKNPLLNSIGSIAASPFALGDVFNNAAKMLAGKEITNYNKYDGYVTPGEYSLAVESGITQHLNDTFGTITVEKPFLQGLIGEEFGLGSVYGMGMSVAKTALYGKIGKSAGLGSISSSLLGYFGASASSAFDEALERGANDGLAFLYGLAIGGLEVGTEAAGLDNLMKISSGKYLGNVGSALISQALAEGSEELASAIGGSIMDTLILGDNSQFAYDVAALREKGYETPEARWGAFTKMVGGWGNSALTGAITGAVGGGLAVAENTIKSDLKSGIAYSQAMGDNVSSLPSEALNYSPDSNYAQRMQEKVDKGGKLGIMQVGHLANQISQAIYENDANAVKTAVSERLTELGEEGNVDRLSNALTKQIMGEELSVAEQSAINKSKNGYLVLTEADPENIRGGGLANKWAESIGTKRLNADVYNRQTKAETANSTPENAKATEAKISPSGERVSPTVVTKNAEGKTVKSEISSIEVDGDKATFTLANGEKVNADKATFQTETQQVVAKMAVEKISRVEGFSTEAATAMVKGYNENLTPGEYNKVFTDAFNAGKENLGTAVLRKMAKENNVSEATLFAAYDIGREFTKNSTSVLKTGEESGIINTVNAEATNEGRQGLSLRNGGKWFNGKNTQRQVPGVESGAGQAQSRGEVGGYADSEIARFVNEGREVTVADLGILGGSKYQKVRILDREHDTKDTREAREYGESRGLNVIVITGGAMQIEGKLGKIDEVNGYILGKNMIIRADHGTFTSTQFARHEAGHDMIAKGEVDIKAVRSQIKKVLQTDEGINEAAKHYEEAYSGTGLTADEIWEEMICDSLGDMNIFSKSEKRAAAAEIMKTALPAIQQAVAETKTEGGQETRGSPAEVLYNKRDGKKGWGKKYGTAQEALNDAIKGADENLWNAFNNEVESGRADSPITNAIIAVQQDVRQDTITPIQGAKLLSEVYQKGGAKALDRLYIHETGNLYPKALEMAKQYSTSAGEVTEGKASRDFGEYTEKQYNNFGWVRANDVVNEGYWDNFTRNYADAVNNKNYDRISFYGDYMIPIYDESLAEKDQVIDHIVFARGSIESPAVTRVIRIYEFDEAKLSRYRSNIYALERERVRQETSELLEVYVASDFRRNGYVEGGSRKISGDNNQSESKRSRSEITANPVVKSEVNEDAGTVTVTYKNGDVVTEPWGKGKASRELDVDSEGNELSPAVAKRFANSKVVDENGRLKVVYHGTVSGEFDIFDKSKGSVEGDFGSGFYFTDKETDVEKNYEFGGPDFDNKVWRRAEQIWDEDPDIDMEDAREQAKKELYKESHRFEVYLNIENPAIVGETILFDNDKYLSEYSEEDYDNYDDYIGDVDQLVTDDIDNIIWDIERNVDLYSNTDSIRNVLYEAYYEGGVSIEKLKEKINELYLESNNGDVVSNEVTRQIIESLGYDGIIDPTVSTKFKNMGMEADTTHYIVFKPNQIKDVGNKNPTDNPSIHLSRELDIDAMFEDMDWEDLMELGGSTDVTLDDISEELSAPKKKVEIFFRRKGLGNSYIAAGKSAVMKQSRLDEAIEDSGAKFNPDYARKYITRISPSDFIDLTVKRSHMDRSAFDAEVEGDHGSKMGDYDYDKALKEARNPYLRIYKATGEVFGHNGRHRMRALELAGIESVEIEIELYDEDGYLIKNGAKTIEDMAISSQFDTAIETHLSNVIPLNEVHRSEIESSYGEKVAKEGDVKYSRELDLIDYVNEQAGIEASEGTKSQQVANLRQELERSNVSSGEVMAIYKLAEKMFDRYGGDSTISEFKYGLLEATKLVLDGSEKGFDAAYDIIHTLAREVAYNPKNLGGEAEMLAEIKRDIRGTKMSVHEADKTSGEFDKYGGYGAFRKNHLGKFMLANEGIQVDAKYAELQNIFGKAFFPDVNTVSEQLLEMARLMDTPLSDYMMVSEEELEATTESMVNSLFKRLGDIWNDASKRGIPLINPNEIKGTVSNRELLATALESITEDQKEKNILRSYKAEASELNKAQKRLLEVRTELKSMWGQKGEKVDSLRKEKAELEAKIDKADQRLVRIESMEAVRGVIQRERSKAYKAAAEKGREALHKNVEGRHKTAEKQAIRGIAKDLEKLLNRGTKERNIKQGERGLIEKVLELTDMLYASDDELLLNGIGTEFTKAEAQAMDDYMKLYDKYHSYDDAVTANKEIRAELRQEMADVKKGFAEVLERERQRISSEKAADAFDAVIEEYKKLKNSDKSYIKDAYDDDVVEQLEQFKGDIGKTTIADMTLEQLKNLHKSLTLVKTTIQNSNKLFKTEGSLQALGEEARTEIEKKGHKEKFSVAETALSKLAWNNLKPIYLLERIGSKVLQKLGKAIFGSESKWATIMSEARDFATKTKAKYGFKNWDFDKKHSFKNSFGQSYNLTLGQMMSVYAYSKRGEQALNHLRTDGFVFDDTKVKEKNKWGIPISYELNDSTAYKITDKNLFDIIDGLTKEQKAYVDDMQKYLSEVMGAKGNEVSMQLYGIEMFGEENYFPIHTSSTYLERARQQQNGEAKLKNKGFTKQTKPGAQNAVVLSEFGKVWSEHVSEMASYSAFTLAMEDFYKVYNYNTASGENNVKKGVISALENAYGKAATSAIDQLLKDLNGGARTDSRETVFKQMLTQFKRAKTMLSLSVVAQQPSAIERAKAMVDAKYFVGQKIGETKRKELWAEVKKYAPVAVIKEMGHFDVGMGRSSADWLMADEYGTLAEKVKGIATDKEYRNEALSYLPAKADELAWVEIWNAVKRETASKNPKMNTSSKEFLNKAGERFEDVIRHTQVYDSTLSRSANMRSKSGLVQMEMAFMAEPTTSINMLEMGLRSGDRKTALKTIGAVYASYLLNAILVAVPYAMRDDDEDETMIEKYVSAMASSFLSNSNPLTSIPIAKDVWSLLQGYSIERSDMSLIEDATNSIRKVFVALRNGEGIGKTLIDLAGDLSAFTGLPVDNVIRDMKSIVNAVKTVTRDIEGMETTWNSVLDELQETAHADTPIVSALVKESKSDKLYDAVMKGDTVYAERIRDSYASFSAYKSALRKALRENDERIVEAAKALNLEDDKTYNKLLEEIASEGNFDKTLIEEAIKAEANADYSDLKSDNNKIREAVMATMMGDDKKRIEIEKAIAAEGNFSYNVVYEARKAETNALVKLLNEAKAYIKAGRYSDAEAIYNFLVKEGYTREFIEAQKNKK